VLLSIHAKECSESASSSFTPFSTPNHCDGLFIGNLPCRLERNFKQRKELERHRSTVHNGEQAVLSAIRKAAQHFVFEHIRHSDPIPRIPGFQQAGDPTYQRRRRIRSLGLRELMFQAF
jgi:hypothetical protein